MRFRTKPVLGISLGLLAALAYWSYKMKTPSDLIIETVGLDDAGISIQSPYGTKSIHHALLVNGSSHYLLACEVLFEFVTKNGEVQTARKVVAFEKLLHADPKVRNSLLNTQPSIKPHSKMLVGLGVQPDLFVVTGTLPAPGTQAVEEQINFDLYSKLVVRLNAVVLENGEAVGPGAADFLRHLETLLKED